jgi:DNA-binding transcriptional ArsR family regulator
MLTPKERQKLDHSLHDIDIARITAVLNALSEPNRCLIFRALARSRNASVGDIAQVVGISVPLASRHLKTLFQTGLLSREKTGKHVYYTTNTKDPLVSALKKAIEK